MQNGDYDGDRFSATWDPVIVDNFKNAPSPPGLPNPESFGIQVDDRKLDGSFITSNKKATREFLDFSLNFRCQQGVLGLCTNFHNSFAYAEGSIKSVGVEALADLHDLLVDSPKMGYTFTEDEWKKFIASDPRITHKNPEESLHKRLLGGASPEDIRSSVPKNAVDRLLLLTVIPIADAILTEVQDLWKNNSIRDNALYRPLQAVQQLADKEQDYHEDLQLLIKGIKEIHMKWKSKFHGNTDSTDSVAFIEELHNKFRDLMPNTPFWNLHQEMEITMSPSPTAWDLLKASVAYDECTTDAFALRMAGKELGFIKAWSMKGARTISPLFHASMKIKSIKHVPVQEHEED